MSQNGQLWPTFEILGVRRNPNSAAAWYKELDLGVCTSPSYHSLILASRSTMRFAPTFVVCSLLPAFLSAAAAHVITPHKSRTLADRQFHHPRPRADLLDLCASINLSTILLDNGILEGILKSIGVDLDLCLCLEVLFDSPFPLSPIFLTRL